MMEGSRAWYRLHQLLQRVLRLSMFLAGQLRQGHEMKNLWGLFLHLFQTVVGGRIADIELQGFLK